MPDISRLNELSQHFNVSVDEILGNNRMGEITEKLLQNQPIEHVTLEEVEEVTPILHEQEVDTLVGYVDENEVRVKDIASVAPFLSQKFLDEFAKKLVAQHGLYWILPIAPFLSVQCIDEEAEMVFKQTGDLGKVACIAPFISKQSLERLIDSAYQKSGKLDSIKCVASFICFDKLGEIAMNAYNEGGINAVLPIAPFLRTDMLNTMAKDALDKYGLPGIAPIMPFIDGKIVEEYIAGKRVN